VLWASQGLTLDVSSVSLTGWFLAVLSGVLYYALAFAFYLSGLKHVAASVAGVFLALVPVFGVLAATLSGESLSARQWLGVLLVVASVLAVARTTPAPSTSQASR
jgi:drug/metabolite transporter (DMT)-like permease